MSDTTKGLRELADFLDANPQLELTTPSHMIYVSERDKLAEIARQGSWAKTYRGDYFNLVKTFSGDVTLEVFTDRDAVCRKVVTGHRVVPAQPATEEHTVEIVEWVCDDALLVGR